MKLYSSNYSIPKSGNSEAEIEDAFYPDKGGELESERLSFAVGDGASEGMYSKQWASYLVHSFCERNESDFRSAISTALESWNLWKVEFIQSRQNNKQPLQWFEEQGLDLGGYSTLLGLDLVWPDNKNEGSWRSIAIGDTCLFQIRDDQIIVQSPISCSADFSNHPFLVCSNTTLNVSLEDNCHESNGFLRANDQLFIMTDALACWFITMNELNRSPWRIIRDLDTVDNQGFADFIENLRYQKHLRNDDTTLVRIDIF